VTKAPPPSDAPAGERIAKLLARAGVASRRDAERLIAEGRVALNGQPITSPALNLPSLDGVTVNGKAVAEPERTRLWRFHKPAGCVTTNRDPDGRPTVFDHLPRGMPRVVTVGRLDFNTEGLLLLTNDGALARMLELPASGFLRTYRVRTFGRVDNGVLGSLIRGVTIEGVRYGPVRAHVEARGQGGNSWLSVSLSEGKNREVRRICSHLGLTVSRLIRVQFGPFGLGDLALGAVDEVPAADIARLRGTARAS
jgi:23S rRNA pseudouridine2605 synthase